MLVPIMIILSLKFIQRSKNQKPMVIVVPSYNNKDWYKKNLDSVFMQQYDNYRVIYINDASTDNTGKLVEEHVKKNNQNHRFTIIHNKKNVGAMANHYRANHMCQDNEIIVHLDGDDWFKHEYALQRINKAYQNENIWLTYGQFEELYLDKTNKKLCAKIGLCKKTHKSIINKHAYRECNWVYSQPRTFYAGLFKHIKLCDFLYDGKFFEAACDVAMIYPMLELSGGKFMFIDEILYVYNTLNPIRDHTIRFFTQLHIHQMISASEKYQPLKIEGIPKRNIPRNAAADFIIISDKNPDRLEITIKSIKDYAKGLRKIYIIPKNSNQNFKRLLEQTIRSSKSNYIFLTEDNMAIKNFVDISRCIQLLEQTYAYGFYLALGKDVTKNCLLCRNQRIPNSCEVDENIHAWQFKSGEYHWREPNNLAMTLYRKQDILNTIQPINYNSIEQLTKHWNSTKFNTKNVGLFFEKSKATTI